MTSDVEFTNNMCMLSSTHTRKSNVLFWDFEEEFYWDVTFHLLTYALITGCITHPRSDMWHFSTSIPVSSSYQFACFYYFVPNSCGGKDAYHPHDLWVSQSASHSFSINSSLILFCLTFSFLKIHLCQGEIVSVGSLRKSIPSFLQAFYSHTHIAKVCLCFCLFFLPWYFNLEQLWFDTFLPPANSLPLLFVHYGGWFYHIPLF